MAAIMTVQATRNALKLVQLQLSGPIPDIPELATDCIPEVDGASIAIPSIGFDPAGSDCELLAARSTTPIGMSIVRAWCTVSAHAPMATIASESSRNMPPRPGAERPDRLSPTPTSAVASGIGP